MKPRPTFRDDGQIGSFEVRTSLDVVCSILRTVEGVTDIRRQHLSEDKVVFKLYGENCVVNEPYTVDGNSDYWIVPSVGFYSSDVNFQALHVAFVKYNDDSFLVKTLKSWFKAGN